MNLIETIPKIHKRQVARFLSHLEDTGQATAELTQDVKRAYGYAFGEVMQAILVSRDEKDLTGTARLD